MIDAMSECGIRFGATRRDGLGDTVTPDLYYMYCTSYSTYVTRANFLE